MKRVLLCLDADPQPSVFDAVVAVDAGVDVLLRHGGVEPSGVEPLVHGVIFTRGPSDLKHTAVFVGGSDVAAAEELLERVCGTFFGPMRVSVMFDANGSNTTAAAAVVAAERHLALEQGVVATVVGTGPVGQRAARMLAGLGVAVRIVSRSQDRAAEICRRLEGGVAEGEFVPCGAGQRGLAAALDGAAVLIAAGPAGVEVVDEPALASAEALRVAVDLNAVPPAGIAGVGPADKAEVRGEQAHYGALAVGGIKMKIHKAALRQLFESNDAVLDAEAILQVAEQIERGG